MLRGVRLQFLLCILSEKESPKKGREEAGGTWAGTGLQDRCRESVCSAVWLHHRCARLDPRKPSRGRPGGADKPSTKEVRCRGLTTHPDLPGQNSMMRLCCEPALPRPRPHRPLPPPPPPPPWFSNTEQKGEIVGAPADSYQFFFFFFFVLCFHYDFGLDLQFVVDKATFIAPLG